MTDQTPASAAPRTAAALALYQAERDAREGWSSFRENLAARDTCAAISEERVLERLAAAEATIAHALVIWQRCLDDTAASAADTLTEMVDLLNEYNVAWDRGERNATD